jgi:hypothetical protein
MRPRSFYILLFGWLSLILWVEFSVDLHLAADGSAYFVTILDHGFTLQDWTRNHSVYLTQWLVYSATRVGITDLPTLRALFAANIYLTYLLSFAACLFATRGDEDSNRLLWPILSIAAINLPASYVLFGESQLVPLLGWPILLILLRDQKWTTSDGVLLSVLALLWTRTYPASLLAALVCIGVALYRLRRDSDRVTMAWGSFFLLIQALHIAVVVHSIISPFSIENRDGMIESLPWTVYSSHFTITVFFLTAILASIALGVKRGLAIAFVVAGSLHFAAGSYEMKWQIMTPALQSFAFRACVFLLLPPLMIAACYFAKRRQEVSSICRLFLLCYLLFTTAYQANMTLEWEGYRRDFRSFLRQNTGYIRVENTPLHKHPCSWGWTNPTLSLAWTDSVVRCVVLNDEGAWDPTGLPERHPLQNYLRYEL